jgi:F-type H+-transporting ATPase subunit b
MDLGGIGMFVAADFNLFEWHPGVTIWTLVIFGLSLPLMIKFVFGPIVRALDERDKKVEQSAAAAQEARKAAEEAVARAAAEREEARAEARRMVQEAQTRAERQAREAVETAKAEADRQLEKAQQEIDAAKQRALQEIRREVVDLSIASASKILRQDVDDEAHRRLVNDFLGKASKN